MGDEELQAVLAVYKVLGDANRLKILGLLANGERSVDELASLLGLGAPTVSHHLNKLKELDIVRMRRDEGAHLYSLNDKALEGLNKRVFAKERMRSWVDGVEVEAWERKVLRDAFDGDTLLHIPRQPKKRRVVIASIAQRFLPGRTYTEKQVNAILKRHHPDVTALRHDLVMWRFLRRDRAGATYWVPERDSKYQIV